jgi:hypothetical protein
MVDVSDEPFVAVRPSLRECRDRRRHLTLRSISTVDPKGAGESRRVAPSIPLDKGMPSRRVGTVRWSYAWINPFRIAINVSSDWFTTWSFCLML